MKRIFNLLTYLLIVSMSYAVQPAAKLQGVDMSTRIYLQSVENGMMGESAWKSNSNAELSTSSYTTTSTLYYPVKLVDDDEHNMYWFNDTLSGWSVSSSATATVAGPTLTTSTLNFVAGSAGVGIILTGTWSIGDTITLSAPAISTGVLSVSTAAVQILTFTE